MRALQTIISASIDYAGLFPPAALDMPSTTRNFADYRKHPHARMLSRLIIPVARLDEFCKCADGLLPHTGEGEGWRISALTAPASNPAALRADIDRILSFNDEHDTDESIEPAALIDCIELKADSAADIDAAISDLPEGLNAFFEIPIDNDPRGLITALAGEPGVGAKVRTGGVTPDLFPSSSHLARFLTTCAAADVPFKATAGLHHPLRGSFNLTYEDNAPTHTMFGFLNVFLAAAYAYTDRMSPADATRLLEETDPRSISFADEGVDWRGRRLPTEKLARAREAFALSFGSCSFTEPVEDLKALNLL